jgi:glycolate oxidase FAD binding subunit
MGETFKPQDASQVEEAIGWALGTKTPLDVMGRGTKRALGRPVTTAGAVLDLSALSGIAVYEPEELILTAQAATPLSEVQAALSAQGQMLAFEPWDPNPILGGTVGAGTLGGVIMAGLAGPRRIMVGAARDHLLGFKGVSGRGEPFKSGGRVVKNVTGFDLSKLLAGSFGTLAAVTEITCKVLPRPKKITHGVDFGAGKRPSGSGDARRVGKSI